MLFSGKENVFICLVAFQKMFRKIFSDVWLCSWKYHRKHIFYLLLTFSRLPNKYIISFIPQNTNKTQKKSSNPDTSHDRDRREGEIVIGAVGTSHDRYRSFVRSRSTLCVIGTVPVMSANDIDELGFGRSLLSLLSFSLSLFLSLSLSFARDLEMVWR